MSKNLFAPLCMAFGTGVLATLCLTKIYQQQNNVDGYFLDDNKKTYRINFYSEINTETVKKFLKLYYEACKESKEFNLEINIKTYGGFVCDTYEMVKTVANHKGETSCLVEEYSFSGGTVVALVCDKIICNKYTTFTKIDHQIEYKGKNVSFNQLKETENKFKEIENKNIYICKYINYNDIENSIYNEIMKKNQIKYKKMQEKIFDVIFQNKKYFNEKMKEVAKQFLDNSELPHSDRIYPEELKNLGFNIKINNE